MKKRNRIRQLNHEIRALYRTNNRLLDKLVEIELALDRGIQIVDINRPDTAKCVARLVQENKRLQAEIGVRINTANRLRTQAHTDRHELSIGRAINRAANELPDRMSITIDVERDSGTVDLFIRGRLVSEEFHGDDLGEEINAAIDYAIAVAQEQEQQP